MDTPSQPVTGSTLGSEVDSPTHNKRAINRILVGGLSILTLLLVAAVVWIVYSLVAALVSTNVQQTLASLPLSGTTQLSYEFFGLVSLILFVAVLLSLFPLFLQRSFEHTKKARIRGDVWTDLVCLGYWTKLSYSALANSRMINDVEKRPSFLSNQLKAGLSTLSSHPSNQTKETPHQALDDAVKIALREFTNRFEEHYGRRAYTLPLLLVTSLYLTGWMSVLLPSGVSGGQANGIAGLTTLLSGGFSGYITGIAGQLSVVSAAFLGAYLFSVQGLFRRYVRSDFKPTAITQASLRVITGWIAALLLTLMPATTFLQVPNAEQWAKVLGFFTGIFALHILAQIWNMLAGKSPRLLARWWGGRNTELTDLDGLDSWHVDRLDEAGITYVRGMATADFLDLLLAVRLPTETLADWVDQAILRMHVNQPVWNKLQEQTPIRTASDFLDVFAKAPDTDKTRLAKIINSYSTPENSNNNHGDASNDQADHTSVHIHEDSPFSLGLLAQTLQQDPNIAYIRTFREQQRKSVAHAKAFPDDWPISDGTAR